MTNTDNVSCELRKIEKEIDNYYNSNPLLKLPFATAASYLLRSAEEYMLNEQINGVFSTQGRHALGSDFITELEHSMSWLHRDCEQGGKIPFAYDSDLHKASKDLFELGRKYDLIVFAYTCASEGILELELQGSTIQPTGDFFASIEYEAYNILVDAHEPEEAQFDLNPDDFPTTAILDSVRVQGDRFCYELNPKMVTDMKKYLQPLFDRMFLLPSEWQFSCYMLGGFQKVFETVCAIAHIHSAARVNAALLECPNMAYLDSIYVLTYGKLIRCVARCSDMSPIKVKNVFDDLTYGGSDIKRPIPALQPLIKLNSRYYAIAPHIWICSSAERNFTALLNRMQNQNQKIYEKFTNKKEDLMKKRFTTGLCNKDFKFISGNITNLTDVDLAIVNHSEKACLLLELKWFIAPTTAHERINKSKEIKKGVSQILKLKQAFVENHKPLLEKLNIDTSYRLEGAVVSENWIGYGNVQNPEVPVIRANHLIEKLKTIDSLRATMEWLKDREYLPKEGEHFTVHRPPTTIGNWTIKWYGIKSLTENAFFPV
ncbi:MAG: hypothetical protein OXU23_27255 [Candidatus Poribacteria bacterium]|nr:hypothetical protein [Candidatus Poribacteria bacterium]MDE0469578.1 hypothetical protein [Candidatus Poribacteria bacterium]